MNTAIVEDVYAATEAPREIAPVWHMPTRMVEFVSGPVAGKALPHREGVDGEIMPKFIMVGDNESLLPIHAPSVDLYFLSDDGNYHFMKIE